MRRRIFIAVIVCTLVGLAVVANYGPVTHYLDARSRLEKAASEVAALEEQNTQMQAELSKLLQPGYLEELAREQLTYSRPGEELYIVTGDQREAAVQPASAGAGVGAVVSTSDEPDANVGSATTIPGAADSTAAGVAADEGDDPGFLERLLSRIANVF